MGTTEPNSWMNFRKYYLLEITDHNVHYIGKSIVSPPSNERFDYFSNFHEYKSLVISKEDLHLNSHSIGMTEVLQCEGGLFWGHWLCPRNSKSLKCCF